MIHKIMPTRGERDMSMVVDLDDLVTRPVGFRFRGKLHRVEPVSAQTFMELSDALSEAGNLLDRARAGDKLGEEAVYAAYQKFVSVLCPSFTVNLLRDMQLPQVHALINLIIKHATGQPMRLEEITEKKKMTLSLGG
jgi:hypothetical protein